MESPITLKSNYWQTRVSECADPLASMTSNSAPLGYSIVPITNRDSDRVLDLLRRFFFRDEPLNVCVGLLDNPQDTCEELEQYCMESIGDGVSIMAVSPNGNILGVCINGTLTRDEKSSENKNDEDECSNPKFRKILKLLSTVYRESNVFKQFPEVDKLLDIRVVSVDDSCRGQGIAKALFDKTKNLAKELNIPLVRVDCTSHFSAKAVARLGFDCVYTLPYSEHLDSDGYPVFTPELPHTCVKTYVHLVDLDGSQ
ncbi:arylalkylamine N-acetyltransferase 1-like isoform X3 [Homalodisca vitripennis]|uniref:arylalkylamine N-acetyltransferase 1-like isoform X3 n=2 Tax=Homalodisca vitripennis TaxID=197043 RepID=UPI001EEBF253|nr:arylalkylamine N-acetyltransferase 1-like isoform X3 [Homalodisca vitripennis]